MCLRVLEAAFSKTWSPHGANRLSCKLLEANKNDLRRFTTIGLRMRSRPSSQMSSVIAPLTPSATREDPGKLNQSKWITILQAAVQLLKRKCISQKMRASTPPVGQTLQRMMKITFITSWGQDRTNLDQAANLP